MASMSERAEFIRCAKCWADIPRDEYDKHGCETFTRPQKIEKKETELYPTHTYYYGSYEIRVIGTVQAVHVRRRTDDEIPLICAEHPGRS